MKDVIATVNEGRINLDKMLRDFYCCLDCPRTVRGVRISYFKWEWKTIKARQSDIEAFAEKQGIRVSFDDGEMCLHFKYFR